jgi:hypothetical protein
VEGDVKVGETVELDRPAGLQGREFGERAKGTPSLFREKRAGSPDLVDACLGYGEVGEEGRSLGSRSGGLG